MSSKLSIKDVQGQPPFLQFDHFLVAAWATWKLRDIPDIDAGPDPKTGEIRRIKPRIVHDVMMQVCMDHALALSNTEHPYVTMAHIAGCRGHVNRKSTRRILIVLSRLPGSPFHMPGYDEHTHRWPMTLEIFGDQAWKKECEANHIVPMHKVTQFGPTAKEWAFRRRQFARGYLTETQAQQQRKRLEELKAVEAQVAAAMLLKGKDDEGTLLKVLGELARRVAGDRHQTAVLRDAVVLIAAAQAKAAVDAGTLAAVEALRAAAGVKWHSPKRPPKAPPGGAKRTPETQRRLEALYGQLEAEGKLDALLAGAGAGAGETSISQVTT